MSLCLMPAAPQFASQSLDFHLVEIIGEEAVPRM